jgi:hypothetical protein
MAAFNRMLLWAVNVPMSTKDQKAELEYIYEAAKLNGYDQVPIQELLQKHERKIFVRQHTTLQSLEKEIRISSIFSKSHEQTHTHLQQI